MNEAKQFIGGADQLIFNYQVCLWLLYFDPAPTCMQYQQMMRIYCVIAKNKPTEEAGGIFILARIIAEKTFSGALKQLELYQYICQKIGVPEIETNSSIKLGQ